MNALVIAFFVLIIVIWSSTGFIGAYIGKSLEPEIPLTDMVLTHGSFWLLFASGPIIWIVYWYARAASVNN